MSEGYFVALIIVLALIYGRLASVRDQMKRIADFCERSEKRINEQSGRRS